MAGADFIRRRRARKRERDAAGFAGDGAVHSRLCERTGCVGFKPAAGSHGEAGDDWLALMKDELGRPWLEPSLFRIGASGMLGDIERQLEHYLTGITRNVSHPWVREDGVGTSEVTSHILT